MIASVVIGNLIYLGGAVVLMVVLTLVVVIRQRKPKSVEANMESFNRGLKALAPGPAGRPPASAAPRPGAPRRRASRSTSVQTVARPDDGPTPEPPPG